LYIHAHRGCVCKLELLDGVLSACPRHLYKVLLTLPVTTASVESGFSKLSLVKSKLRSTMTQETLEALLLATVEKDLLLCLDDAALVACFAAKAERKFLLA